MSEDVKSQTDLAQKALSLKTEGDAVQHHPETEDHANDGMVSIPFADQAPSGALDAEGHRAVLERSRKIR